MIHALPSERTIKGELSKAYAIVYNAGTDRLESESVVFSGL
jgi:hypothetical protein